MSPIGIRGVILASCALAKGVMPTLAVLGILAFQADAFAQAADGDLRIFAVELRGGKATPPRIQVMKNERVLLRWTSDVETRVHLHGYDIEMTIGPDRQSEMVFKAYATGRFAIEAHHSGGSSGRQGHGKAALLYVDVLPR